MEKSINKEVPQMEESINQEMPQMEEPNNQETSQMEESINQEMPQMEESINQEMPQMEELTGQDNGTPRHTQRSVQGMSRDAKLCPNGELHQPGDVPVGKTSLTRSRANTAAGTPLPTPPAPSSPAHPDLSHPRGRSPDPGTDASLEKFSVPRESILSSPF
ncbi:hypothetical protein DUI87_09717 [Hirundo rustica rustica]|uniref:Uncharacterized protein n=1 Tax=Hirundo rustica rustica TaxID=333673 RepID=A0A3M0KMY9_HIRRU|nr:hypothetical protein DUI87_09717 [Hirundo rustica rustica]